MIINTVINNTQYEFEQHHDKWGYVHDNNMMADFIYDTLKEAISWAVYFETGKEVSPENIFIISTANNLHKKEHKHKKLSNRNSAHSTWAKHVKIRDKYTCLKCGYHGVDVHAHHILSYETHPQLRGEIDNGITLCKECHKKQHIQQE